MIGVFQRGLALTCHGSVGTTKGRPRMSGTHLPPAGEYAAAEVYQGSHRQRRARTAAIDRPRPLEFDRNGFPVAQRTPDFVARVDRLLSP
jgi:hypothetical protein